MKVFLSEAEVGRRYAEAPPIVKAAVEAILRYEEGIDEMGYDIAYYQQDLPKVVTEAIDSWRGM